MRILLIEDDRNIAGFVTKGLREAGHNVIYTDSAQTGGERASGEAFDVIILDRMLPDVNDGLNLVRGWRARQVQTPVMVLSVVGDATAKVSGLRAGCDDYLAKPFAFAELLARVECIGRRGNSKRTPALA
jgi:two-component system OmpR family response regulator